MSGNSKIKAVTFDAGGTLIHLRESVGESYAKVAKQFGIMAEPNRLENSFREVWKKTEPPFLRDDPGINCERDWWHRLVKAVFSQSGTEEVESENFDRFFTRLYDYFAEPGVWVFDKDGGELLDWLEGHGFRVGMISNFDERLRTILCDLGIENRFDPMIISNEIRRSKPDPKIFEYALRELSLGPDQVLHVGDDPICDVEGAARVGIETFLVGRKGLPLLDLIKKLS